MCTALNLKVNNHYFGRNLDLDCSYGEQVVVMPRNYPLTFRRHKTIKTHYAMIGMAVVIGGMPLFYDAVNEYGISMAGLNFPENAFYFDEEKEKDNICQFEFIPWVLRQCKNLSEVKKLLERINIVNIPFSDKFPVSPLHWIISHKESSLTVESMKDGLYIYENAVGVLTNNPPFSYQMFNLNNYRNLKVTNGENTFSDNLTLENYCQGLGAIGLPGDVSSMSRFVRMVFNKENSVCEGDENSSVSQFFHLLQSVSMTRGVCLTPNGKWDITVYSSCMNTDKGLYYYTTYNNQQINCVDMQKEDLDGSEIKKYPLILNQKINLQN